MSTKLGEIADFLEAHGGIFPGNRDQFISRIAPLTATDTDSITFLSNRQFLAHLQDTEAGCVLVAPGPKSWPATDWPEPW